MPSAVDQEIRELIRKNGRITFAQFMQVCLYSPRGGFYSSRGSGINSHFGTSPAAHPAFGALVARQLEQMWHLLGNPSIFSLIEVGAGDGLLARSIVDSCQRTAPRLARALNYVAADYQPGRFPSPGTPFDRPRGSEDAMPPGPRHAAPGVQRVKAAGLGAFRNVEGCILCNELIDNFPVHRFAMQDGRVREVFVTLDGENLVEVLDEPSSPRIEERLAGLALPLPDGYRGEVNLAVPLPDGYRGEVNLAMEDWTGQLSTALQRGFVLTIDYGALASDLYSPANSGGAMVCYRQHRVSDDPYRHPGQQDITCLVDFTSLMRMGERHGLQTVGFAPQSRFLQNLGFSAFLADLRRQGLSAARAELERMALMALVDPDQYGDFQVLAQAKGVDLDQPLVGFR